MYWNLLGADLLDMESRRERLLELVGLLRVVNDEGVEEACAADLELGLRHPVVNTVLLDASRLGVPPAGDLKELLDVGDLLRLRQRALRTIRKG